MVSAGSADLGIDVGGTRIKWALLDGHAVIERGEIATARMGAAAVLAQVTGLVSSFGKLKTVGLAMPGLVDTVKRETLLIPNIAGDWEHCAVGEAVERMSAGAPVSLLNDARAFGLAELRLGAGRGYSDAVFITIGTGIGGALAIAGRIMVSDVDRSPEMGHVVVEMPGELCGCGATGCLETVASASAIVSSTSRALLTGQSQILTRLCSGKIENLTAEVVGKAAGLGDPWAIAAFERAGSYLGMAAASTCVLLETQCIIVGGGMAGAFPHLAPSIERVVTQRSKITGHVGVLRATLGPHAGSIGAALFAQETLDSEAAEILLGEAEGGLS